MRIEIEVEGGDAGGDQEESEGKGIPIAELAHYHVHKVY